MKFFLSIIAFTILSFSVFAQATATSSVSANIMVPITITNTNNMFFGNIAVSASVPGTVVLTPGSIRTATGGVTLPAITALVQSAAFAITGQASFTYAITLNPSSILNDGFSHFMNLTAINSSPAITGTLSTGGSGTITVGGTLNVDANQFPGLYTNSSGVTITINYN